MKDKWTYLMFALGGLVLAYMLLKTGDWAWSYYGTKSNELIVDAAAFGIAGFATIMTMRNERVFTLAEEVTAELKKVTWPDRKETLSSTLVVIITVIISAGFLGFFDGLWSYLTKYITP